MTTAEQRSEESPPTPAADGPPGPSGGNPQSYEVIARRYRPRFFREVVGQEAIAETLTQAIELGRLGHAYLFCGPRGVGKTSMARIFARALQCPNASGGDPCNKCPICESIFRGEDLDVREMDGASHRGIDDVRALINNVQFAPSSSPFRIFIIDEVHMLTREAFNSLLKTLEEPPAHVKFFFATTEPEKILPTVLSRCQRFDFSPISPSDIVRRLGQICELEGAVPEEGVLEKIASLARGGMRDSQSMLDQLLSFAGTEPAAADLDRITGRLSDEAVEQLLALVETGARAEVVLRLQEVDRGGTDPAVLLDQVIEALRGRLHAGVTDGWGEVEIDRNLLAQEILQEARARIRRLGRADIVLELALLRLSTLADLVPISRWTSFLEEGGPPAGESATASAARAPTRPSPPPSSASRGEPAAAAEPEPRVPPTAGEREGESAPGQPSSGEPSPGRTRAAALLDSLETPKGAKPRPAATRSYLAEDEAPAIDGSDPRRAVREALARVSGSAHRATGERFELERREADSLLRLPAGVLQLLAEKRDALRRELARAFDRPVRIEEGSFPEEGQPEDSVAPAEEVVPLADAEVPEIVEKAREIFRGELFRGAPPRN